MRERVRTAQRPPLAPRTPPVPAGRPPGRPAVRRVALQVEMPEEMPLGSVREILAMHGVTVIASENGGAGPSWRPEPASVSVTDAERAVLRAFTYCDSNEEIAAALH